MLKIKMTYYDFIKPQIPGFIKSFQAVYAYNVLRILYNPQLITNP